MSTATAAEKIVAEALSLAPRARAFVAERLIESLDAVSGEELSPAWREELRRRCREMDEGLGQRFLTCLQDALNRTLLNPELYPFVCR